MDYGLSEEQEAFRQTAREFSQRELAPHAARWDAEQIFPKDVLKKAGEVGFMSLYTPQEVGGLGLGRLDSSLVIEELARGCTSTTAFMTIHNMALWMIAMFATSKAKDTFAEALISGEKLASYCLTEATSGSDAASLRSLARKHADAYVLNGTKIFISGAGATDVLVVMARVDSDGSSVPGPNGISSFVVPADAPGVSYGRNEQKMGWNSQPTRAVTFENVEIPAAHRLGKEGEGFRIAMQGLDGGRINIATCSVGTAQAALDQAVAYVQERHQFDQPLAEFQSVQFKLADMLTELVAARQMVHLAAWKLDEGDPHASLYSAMAKRFATDVGFAVANEALQLHGGYGYMKEYPLERHVRDSRVHQILEGTNEIMRVIISRRLLMEGANEVIR